MHFQHTHTGRERERETALPFICFHDARFVFVPLAATATASLFRLNLVSMAACSGLAAVAVYEWDSDDCTTGEASRTHHQ